MVRKVLLMMTVFCWESLLNCVGSFLVAVCVQSELRLAEEPDARLLNGLSKESLRWTFGRLIFGVLFRRKIVCGYSVNAHRKHSLCITPSVFPDDNIKPLVTSGSVHSIPDLKLPEPNLPNGWDGKDLAGLIRKGNLQHRN